MVKVIQLINGQLTACCNVITAKIVWEILNCKNWSAKCLTGFGGVGGWGEQSLHVMWLANMALGIKIIYDLKKVAMGIRDT